MEEHHTRNLGFFSKEEQEKLKSSKVAIAGAGGDGFQLGLKLAMMGVEHFSVADPEVFEAENSNRVLGATALALGQNKAVVFMERVLELRPEAKIEVYTDGVTEDNLEDFMQGADLVLDESELTYPHVGTMIARQARKQQIPNEIAMNIGFAGTVTSLKPDAKYWNLERILGLPQGAPLDEIKDMDISLPHAVPYLPPYGDLDTLRAVVEDSAPLPSISQGVDVACAIGSTEAFLHLVNGGERRHNRRKKPIWAPRYKMYDAYTGKGGNRLNIAQSGYYRSLVQGVIRDTLGLNPKCDYNNIKN